MMKYSEIVHVDLARFTKRTLLVFLLFMCRIGYTQQPVKQIAGVVVDAQSKSPLSGANVYIQQTTIASTTKEDGTFVLNVPSGNYNLIVSYVGYKPFLHALDKNSSSKILVNLEADTKILNEVAITVDLNWQTHFSLFQKLFLGKNAGQCTIRNSKVLSFNYNKEGGVMTAEASEPLVIDNYVLGYTLYYDLGSFIHYEGRTSYSGFTRYQEMTPKVNKDRRTWKANRSRAYLGSSIHFMHSLVNDRLRKAGFVIKKLVKTEHPPTPLHIFRQMAR